MCDSRNKHMIATNSLQHVYIYMHTYMYTYVCSCLGKSNLPCVSDPVAIGHVHASLVPDGYTGGGMEFALSCSVIWIMYGNCTSTNACSINSVSSPSEQFISSFASSALRSGGAATELKLEQMQLLICSTDR